MGLALAQALQLPGSEGSELPTNANGRARARGPSKKPKADDPKFSWVQREPKLAQAVLDLAFMEKAKINTNMEWVTEKLHGLGWVNGIVNEVFSSDSCDRQRISSITPKPGKAT